MADFIWANRRAIRAGTGLELWRSLDGVAGRAYSRSPRAGWTHLLRLAELRGASAGQQPSHHYVVETDVLAEHEADFNAWYEQEHLPGLASVPGTVRARRFIRNSGAARYLACYDLTCTEALTQPAWLAVRHTQWSRRVRPTFLNPVRTLYARESSF